jgi:hypothetical protein
MSWISEYHRVWRVVILVLLLWAFQGPWFFDQTNVPSEYPCAIRLKGDFCGSPTDGMYVLWAVTGELISRVVGLVTGAMTPTDAGSAFPFILGAIALLLTPVSTVLLIWRGDRQRQLIFHVAVWGLAAVWSWEFLMSTSELPPSQLWGLWLYVALVPSVLILEGVLAIPKKPHQTDR